jgi:hypothetical protein
MTPTTAAELAALTLALEEAAGAWAKRFPEQGARIVRGLAMVKAGEIFASEEPGVFWVRGHAVEAGRCDCRDHQFRGAYGVRCAHRWALNLAAKAGSLPELPAAEASEEEHAAFISWAMGA